MNLTCLQGGFTLVIDALGQVDRTSLDSQLNLGKHVSKNSEIEIQFTVIKKFYFIKNFNLFLCIATLTLCFML